VCSGLPLASAIGSSNFRDEDMGGFAQKYSETPAV
jgi:hypothetical protein